MRSAAYCVAYCFQRREPERLGIELEGEVFGKTGFAAAVGTDYGNLTHIVGKVNRAVVCSGRKLHGGGWD